MKKLNIKKGHAIICVSPNNKYFSVGNMELLFYWANENYDDFNVFFMNKVSVYNFMALGYDEKISLKKTIKNDSNLHNKIIRALSNCGFNKDKIILLSGLSENQKYKECYNKYKSVFRQPNAVASKIAFGKINP